MRTPATSTEPSPRGFVTLEAAAGFAAVAFAAATFAAADFFASFDRLFGDAGLRDDTAGLAARGALAGSDARSLADGRSRITSLASLSSRSPWNDGCRTIPS